MLLTSITRSSLFLSARGKLEYPDSCMGESCMSEGDCGLVPVVEVRLGRGYFGGEYLVCKGST